MPPDEGAGPLTEPAPGPAAAEQQVPVIVPRRGDGAVVDVNGIADPREVGDLLQAWLNIQMEAVDDLVAEARDKVDAIPRWKTIAQLVGELVVRVYALEQDIEDLKRSRR